MSESVTPRLQSLYHDAIRSALTEKLGIANPMDIPRLDKIVINMGIGEAATDSKKVNSAIEEMTAIAGQKPVTTLASKSVAGFKLREGIPIGCKVTLRRARMYEFLDRLINVALPRVRDYRGASEKSFDGNGNYALGIKEQIVFPEIEYDKIDEVRGMDIVICTTAKDDEMAKALLAEFNMPFSDMNDS